MAVYTKADILKIMSKYKDDDVFAGIFFSKEDLTVNHPQAQVTWEEIVYHISEIVDEIIEPTNDGIDYFAFAEIVEEQDKAKKGG